MKKMSTLPSRVISSMITSGRLGNTILVREFIDNFHGGEENSENISSIVPPLSFPHKVRMNQNSALCHLACRKMWYNKEKASLRNSSCFSRKESMSLIALLLDLPGCSVDQVSQTEESIVIIASATTSSASCPGCQQVSSHVHSTYIRSPKALPSSGHPVRLHLQVRRFRCANSTCRRKTFAETFPLLIVPRARAEQVPHKRCYVSLVRQ